jgi:uncharacterized protein with PIN domain
MRFLLDGMLGKLARWLRMIGYEAEYLNDCPDNKLISKAKRDSLILLTSDEELYRLASARGIDAYYVQGRTEVERLAELARRYNLDLKIDTSNSRCPVCGAPVRDTPRAEVKDSVPPTTFKVYQSFWVCTNPNCAKIYWQGSHWKRIEQTLENARKILDTKGKATAEVHRSGRTDPHRRKKPGSYGPHRHNHVPRK